mgnify:CR=1 FL=1|jgi:hypothetical protein
MKYYTYAYLREDRTPYYIGKGQGNRAYVKRYGKGRARRPKNLNNIILLKQNLTEEEAFKHEIYMIAVFGRKDLGTGILHNRTDGGEGPSGHIPWNKGKGCDEDHKRNISIGRKGIPSHRPGYSPSKETREKIANAKVGRKHTEETCNKMSKTRMGHYVSPETTAKIAKKLCKGPYKLLHTSGEEIIVDNFSQFCRENNLHRDRMMDRIKGKVLNPYKGWTGQVL